MNSKIKTKNSESSVPFSENILKKVGISFLLFIGIVSIQFAQNPENQPKPSWWFGVVTGSNFNYYDGSTKQLNATFAPPLAFHEGFGTGLFLGATFEYYKPETQVGFMLQFGYDNRKGKFDQITTACNCPADLSANISYFTIEPSLRFAPFRNGFYLFGGPRFAFNWNKFEKSFAYQLGVNPAVPNQALSPEVTGDFSNVNESIISMQIGAGFDIPISSQNRRTQFVVSPFVSYQPYFGQNPRSIETWNITTIRAGLAIKLGVAKKSVNTVEQDDTVLIEEVTPKIDFTVISPKNIPAERTVRETFPLRNYIFFDLGSTEIPSRYITLEKEQVKDFKEHQLDLYTPENFSGRSKRQLVVYYNILNIIGNRMVKNPNSEIKLVGSSDSGKDDALKMAESVKSYLVDTFSIEESRIETIGNNEPTIPSRKNGTEEELILLKEGERRVSIESNSPEMLMEFQNTPGFLKPIEVVINEEAPIDSYISIENKNASKMFSSWILESKDNNGVVKTFGPFTVDKVTIPGKNILGTNANGTYKMKMIGTTKSGKKFEKETSVDMVLWTPSETDIATRFSVIYEFDEANTIELYDKYITEVIVPSIPKNAKVIIHGHTDIIGNEDYNQNLSTQRALEVTKKIQKALAKIGRNDVIFDVVGFGENENLSPFENNYPEKRFYNRTVIIDIISKK
jgi:outer membrane protein OmpA-like peptidoglycan-associated protein